MEPHLHAAALFRARFHQIFFALLRHVNRLIGIVVGADNGWPEDHSCGHIRTSNALFFLRFSLKFSDLLDFSDQLHATELVVAHLLCVHQFGRCAGRHSCRYAGNGNPFKILFHRLSFVFNRSELPSLRSIGLGMITRYSQNRSNFKIMLHPNKNLITKTSLYTWALGSSAEIDNITYINQMLSASSIKLNFNGAIKTLAQPHP